MPQQRQKFRTTKCDMTKLEPHTNQGMIREGWRWTQYEYITLYSQNDLETKHNQI